MKRDKYFCPACDFEVERLEIAIYYKNLEYIHGECIKKIILEDGLIKQSQLRLFNTEIYYNFLNVGLQNSSEKRAV